MFTIKDFVEKFNTYQDKELLEMLQNIEGYSAEAQTALHTVIETRGGVNRLLHSVAQRRLTDTEVKRIENEIYELSRDGFDKAFISNAISSGILPDEQVAAIIHQHHYHSIKDIEDKKVDQQTISRCLIAGIIASLISGAALGMLLIFTSATHILIVVGIALCCYAIIKAIVKKSKNNTAVIITTITSTITAMILGALLFRFFGPAV
jgi:hypothetical protein